MATEYNESATTNDRENQYQIVIPTGLRVSRVIAWLMYAWALFGAIMLTVRVFLLAAGANIGNGFAWFVVDTSNTYLRPFRGIFEQQQIGDSNFFDVSAIFAAIMYILFGWGFQALLQYVQRKIDRSAREQEYEIRRLEDRERLEELAAAHVERAPRAGARKTRTTTTHTTRRS